MSTNFPTSIDSYSTKVDAVDDVLASHVNNLQDAIVALETKLAVGAAPIGQWTYFTPIVTQAVGITLTITHSHYAVANKIVFIDVGVTCTSGGSNGIVVALDISNIPAAYRPAAWSLIGTYYYLDSLTAIYIGAAYAINATTIYGAAHNLANNIGVTPAFTVANGDQIKVNGFWRIA